MKVNWKGVFPALTTQFKPDQALDLPATAKHLETLIQAGIHGVVLLGTVGENTALAYEEKLSVLCEMRKTAAGRIPVLAGAAEYTTALACRYARDAENIGLDGLMVLPGMVYKSDGRETFTHFRTVARSTGLPIMIYNNPVSYSVDVPPEGFAQLADEANIVAIKESSENVRRMTDLRNLLGDRFILFAGVDDLFLESAMLGAQGWVAGLVNAFPRETVALWDLAASGKWPQGRELYRWFTPLPAPRYQDQAGAIHQAGHGPNRNGLRDGARSATAGRGRGAGRNSADYPERHRRAAGVAGCGGRVMARVAPRVYSKVFI